MKDATHHRLQVQRKVMQSLRREMEKETKSHKDDEGLGSLPLDLVPGSRKRLSTRRRGLRVPA